MAEEENRLVPRSKTPDELYYKPEELDISEFDIIVDHSQWKALCRLAQDRNTNVSTLWACILERVLSNINYVNPADPKGVPHKLHVTVRDLRGNPKAAEFGPNKILQAREAQDAEGPTSCDSDAKRNKNKSNWDFLND